MTFWDRAINQPWPREKHLYRIALEDDDTVIRIKRDLMNQGMVAKLLDLINLAAVLENRRFAGAQKKMLGHAVSDEDLDQGSIYPPLARIREVSAAIAAAVAEAAYRCDLATHPQPDDLPAYIKSLI